MSPVDADEATAELLNALRGAVGDAIRRRRTAADRVDEACGLPTHATGRFLAGQGIGLDRAVRLAGWCGRPLALSPPDPPRRPAPRPAGVDEFGDPGPDEGEGL